MKMFGNNNQSKPKRLQFVLDVSGSMYRFNGRDNRCGSRARHAVTVYS